MSNFTDSPQLPQFTPYTPQLPVEAMAQVGMQREQMYQAGIQKIQANIDSIAGLDIMKDVDKNYLQSKLNELGNKLTTVAAGDFSNFQLTNSVAGMTKQVIKDKNIQNAVQSTANIRKQLAEIETAKKKGESSPANEDKFNTQLNEYLTSQEVGTSFNSKYIPYFDRWKFAKEQFDTVKPGKMSWDDIYKHNADGSIQIGRDGIPIYSETMVRHEIEGRDLSAVKSTLNQIFADPRFIQQAGIDAEFQYKNYTPQDLISTLETKKQKSLYDLNAKYQQATLNGHTPTISQNVTDAANEITKTYDDYMKLAITNPTLVKKFLLNTQEKENYTSSFGVQYKTDQLMESPQWKALFEIQKEKNNNYWKEANYKKDLAFHADEEKDKAAQRELTRLGIETNLEIAKLKAEGKTKTGPNGEDKFDLPQPTEVSILTSAQDNVDRVNQDYQSASDNLLATTVLNMPSFRNILQSYKDRGVENPVSSAIDYMAQNVFHMDPIKYRTQQLGFVMAHSDHFSKQSNVAKDALTNFNKADLQWKSYAGTRKDLEDYKAISGSLQPIKGYKSPYTGQTTDVTSSDMVLLQQYLKWKSELHSTDEVANEGVNAKKLLTQRGKGFLIDDLNTANFKEWSAQQKGNITKTFLEAGANLLRSGSAFLQGWNTDEYAVAGGKVYATFAPLLKGINNNELSEKSILERLRRNTILNPEVGQHLMQGKEEDKENFRNKVQQLVATYNSGNKQNESPDFSEFAKLFDSKSTLKEANFDAKILGDGTVILQGISGSEYKGSMRLSPIQAANLGIDVEGLRAPQEANDLAMYMKSQGTGMSYTNKTKNINDFGLYRTGDAFLNKTYFPNITDPNIDVKVNFQEVNGKYYPYIYIKGLDVYGHPKEDIVDMKALDPSLSGGSVNALGQMMYGLKQLLTDSKVKQLLYAEKK